MKFDSKRLESGIVTKLSFRNPEKGKEDFRNLYFKGREKKGERKPKGFDWNILSSSSLLNSATRNV